MVLPIAYMAPVDWYKAYLLESAKTDIEAMESFEKQTYRNRCLITTPDGPLMLSVPVKKVEHKQLTRDIEISYQSRWQHQHWISLVSAYKHTPFFDYYADFFRPFYEHETKWLWDLNSGLHEVIVHLLHNSPCHIDGYTYKATTKWAGQELNTYFGKGNSILDTLFEYGPETIDRIKELG